MESRRCTCPSRSESPEIGIGPRFRRSLGALREWRSYGLDTWSSDDRPRRFRKRRRRRSTHRGARQSCMAPGRGVGKKYERRGGRRQANVGLRRGGTKAPGRHRACPTSWSWSQAASKYAARGNHRLTLRVMATIGIAHQQMADGNTGYGEGRRGGSRILGSVRRSGSAHLSALPSAIFLGFQRAWRSKREKIPRFSSLPGLWLRPCASLGLAWLPLARAQGLATGRTQPGYRLAFHENRTGIVQVIAVRALVGNYLYHGGPERLPAALSERARSLGLTRIGRPLHGDNG